MLRRLALVIATVAALAVLSVACSSGSSADPAGEPVAETPGTQTPSATEPSATEPSAPLGATPGPTSNIVVSDAVPTLQELRDMGISDDSAECFIATIDPDNTGRVTNVDLFVEALGQCL